MLTSPHLDRPSLCVKANLELQDLHKGRIDLHPGCAEGRESVGGDQDLAVLRIIGFDHFEGWEGDEGTFHVLVHLDIGSGLLVLGNFHR